MIERKSEQNVSHCEIQKPPLAATSMYCGSWASRFVGLWFFFHCVYWTRVMVIVELVAEKIYEQEFTTKVFPESTSGEPAEPNYAPTASTSARS